MTELVLNLIERWSCRGHTCADDGVVAMKGLLLGMLTCMALGAADMAWIPDGPLTTQQQFMFGLMAGTVGTVAGAAYFEIENLRKLAQHALANLGVSALFGCACIHVVGLAGVSPTFAVVLPVFGTLGMGGSLIVGKVWPAFLEMLANRTKKELRRVIGEETGGES